MGRPKKETVKNLVGRGEYIRILTDFVYISAAGGDDDGELGNNDMSDSVGRSVWAEMW